MLRSNSKGLGNHVRSGKDLKKSKVLSLEGKIEWVVEN